MGKFLFGIITVLGYAVVKRRIGTENIHPPVQVLPVVQNNRIVQLSRIDRSVIVDNRAVDRSPFVEVVEGGVAIVRNETVDKMTVGRCGGILPVTDVIRQMTAHRRNSAHTADTRTLAILNHTIDKTPFSRCAVVRYGFTVYRRHGQS